MDMDEFAQTRAPDDLFDEDYTPVAPVVTTAQSGVGAESGVDTNADAYAYANANANTQANPYDGSYSNGERISRGNGYVSRGSNSRARGRGGRRRGGGDGGRVGGGGGTGEQGRSAPREKRQGLAESKWSGNVGVKGKGGAIGDGSGLGGADGAGENDVEVQASEEKAAGQVDASEDAGAGVKDTNQDGTTGNESDGGAAGEVDTPATENIGVENTESDEKPEKRETAVRGDRSATGGLKRVYSQSSTELTRFILSSQRPCFTHLNANLYMLSFQTKLTEAELTARLSEMSLKNASLTAAHKRAEADEASFQAREAKAATRRLEERANRTQMLGERERNAQRKLKALGHREWDVNKTEEDYSMGRGGAGVGGGGRRGGGGSGRGTMRGGGGGGDDGVGADYRGEDLFDGRDGYATRPRRGNRGGRGSTNSRNSGLNSSRYASSQQPPSNQAADFPPLPTVASKQEQPSTGPPEVKIAIQQNAKDTRRKSEANNDENQKSKIENNGATATAGTGTAPEANPERKESLTLSEVGRQMSGPGQVTSWADQVEGAAG